MVIKAIVLKEPCYSSIQRRITKAVMVGSDSISIPEWLEVLLGEKFFNACFVHEFERKNEENTFCLDCCLSLCLHCLPSHQSHQLLQIRRYVYQDVLRLKDADKLLDCSFVQSYTTNSTKVVFLNQRPITRQFKGSNHTCTVCERSLQRPNLFCSISCKVQQMVSCSKVNSMKYPKLSNCERAVELMEGQKTSHESVLQMPVTRTTSSAINYKSMAIDSVKNKHKSLHGSFCSSVSEVCMRRRKGVPKRSPIV